MSGRDRNEFRDRNNQNSNAGSTGPSKSPKAVESKNRNANVDALRNMQLDGFPGAVNTAAERLQAERLKAMRTLELVSDLEKSTRCKLARKSDITPDKARTGLNKTDYVPYSKKESFNISDLVADHTIGIKDLTSPVNKISFEPSEMTGRSTMCLPQAVEHSRPQMKSVKEILAQSVVEDVRSLSETLPSSIDDASIVRTVDNIPDLESSLASSFRSSLRGCRVSETSDMFGESFKPAEFMMSKLDADERSWEQQYADIPGSCKKDLSPEIATPQRRPNDRDFSIGGYFNKHSDSLRSILSDMHSPPKRPPIALRDDSTANLENLTSTMSSKNDTQMHTQSIDSRTNSRFGKSNDTRNKSQYLSLSAIEKALNEIDLDDSINIIKSRFSLVKKESRSDRPPESSAAHRASTSFTRENDSAEKENRTPNRDRTLEQTIDATRSVLDFSGNSLMPDGSFTRKLLEHPSSWKVSSSTELITPIQQQKRRKRSHSSTRIDSEVPSDHEIPARRSRSPSSHLELAAASGSAAKSSTTQSRSIADLTPLSTLSTNHTITETDRKFLMDAKSPDYGKFSLPSYGPVTATGSTLSNLCVKSRCTSQCSSTSEFSHRDGKIPLKATALEISWGSVPLRKTMQKSLQIKNTSNKRLVMKAEVTGPGFQLASPSTESSNLVVLHSQECRTINLSFCPTVIGAAAGQLVFSSPYKDGNTSPHIINLYGYGGHSNIIPRGISKGPIGSPYLCIGELKQLSAALEESFTLFNKGPLTGFACVVIDSIGLDLPRLCDCITISPKNVLIKPESSAPITITFRPRREDIKKIYKRLVVRNNDVITLANLKLICGEDATRRRVRNLIQQMNDTERSKFEGLPQIWAPLPGEESIKHFDGIKEKADTAFELLSTLRSHEIAITLNHSMLENTIQDTLLFSENDETVMFRTIVSDTSFCGSTNDLSPNVRENDTLEMHRNSVESWSVRPNKIEIDPTDRAVDKAVFSICSNFLIRKSFRVDSNCKHLLQFSPNEGNIAPGEEVQVKVGMKLGFLSTEPIQIWIYLGEDKINLPVIIKKDNFPEHLR